MTALAQALPRPRTKNAGRIYDAVLVVGGSLLIAGLAQLSIKLPFTPVPITGQTLGVLLVGTAFGWARAGIALALYLAEGAIGLPFYAEGKSGAEILGLASATGGYLWGFLLSAVVTGWLANRGWDRNVRSSISVMLIGNILIYVVGIPWLANALDVSLGDALALGLAPFIVGDTIKLFIAAGLLPAAWRLVRREG